MLSYLVSRPQNDVTSEARDAFDALFDRALTGAGNEEIDYDLAWPRWQFICHIADTRPVIVHGSQDAKIKEFEPRKADDAHPFGNRKAIFGSSDGLWSMFYAILDRATHPMLLVNSAMRLEEEGSVRGEPLYFLSISQPALDAHAFRPGMLYFLPRDGFEQMPPEPLAERGHTLRSGRSSIRLGRSPASASHPKTFPFSIRSGAMMTRPPSNG